MRPEFWSDAIVGRLPDATRLFYIGLWNLADDEGWLVWESAEAGALLFPYKTSARRERENAVALNVLERAERVKRYDCGCVEVPRLKDHQRVSGVRSTKVRDLHQQAHKDAKQLPFIAKQLPRNGSDKQSPLSDKPVDVEVRVGRGHTSPLAVPPRAKQPRFLPLGRGNPVGEPA